LAETVTGCLGPYPAVRIVNVSLEKLKVGEYVGELLIGDGPSNGGSRVNDKFLT